METGGINRNMLYILLPGIIGSVFGRLCPMNSGKLPINKSQPPGWVFGIVWPLLYLLVGYNWYLTLSNVPLYWMHWLLIVSLNVWLYLVGCNNKWREGSWLFVAIIAVALSVWILSSQIATTWYQMVLIVPLISWLLFAHKLNILVVEKSY